MSISMWPDMHELPDGTRLTNPKPRALYRLARGDWVSVRKKPWQIVDLVSFRNLTGKIVYLRSLSGTRTARLVLPTTRSQALVYREQPAPDRR